MAFTQRLIAHSKAQGRDIRVAIVGAGQMGHGFGCQVNRIPGMSLSLVIDIDESRIRSLYDDIGATDVVISDDVAVLTKALLDGKPAGTTTTKFVAELPFDIIVESTG
ncbi:MAG: hypothetical protein F2821_04915, partial [Actinobacteria bacterium]|nr:hypothetical protein [Actinomycetota bacterium]